MTRLGFEPNALEKFMTAIRKPWGMVLVTGPTGSGKTNTLYSSIAQLNQPGVNIMTAEDPVEFNLLGINQVQVRENIGLTFANVLRSFLRQDPNIILVGEVRDGETAAIAVKAALTGHLVLSTLHTNDAPSSVNRLVNMGIEPFLVASSMNLSARSASCAHLRRLQGAVQGAGHRAHRSRLRSGRTRPAVAPFRGRGCYKCGGTGYKGRARRVRSHGVDRGVRELVIDERLGDGTAQGRDRRGHGHAAPGRAPQGAAKA